MLKQIYHRHIKARLQGYQATTTASPSATLGIGSMDGTVSRAGAGQPTITPRYPYARRAVVVGATDQTSGAGSGSYISCTSLPTASSLPVSIRNSSGTNVDGVGDVIAFGWDSSNEDVTLQQTVVGSIRSPRVIAARIDGTNATVLQGKKDILSITRNSTGNYTVVFNRSFGRTPVLALTGEGASPRIATYSAKSTTGCTILTYDVSGVLTDCTFHLVAYGQEDKDELGRLRRPVSGTYLLRPTGFSVNAGATTFRLGVGDAAASSGISKTGTGDFTINFREPFGKIPVCVASAISGLKCYLINAPTASAVRVGVLTAGGSASDTDYDVLVFGADERGE